ncbi:MAG: hypothetical protein WDO73_31905 [Ignavibacteriota bacterium]
MRKLVPLLLVLTLLAAAQPVELGVVNRIKTEAFDHSKVMETLRLLADVHGPRLTGSPEFEDAAKWAMSELSSYGLEKVHLEKWGPFGRPWTLEQSSVELLQPSYSQLTAAPLAWSGSTNGPVTADLVLAPLRASFRDGPAKFNEVLNAYRAQWTGKLRGKIVLISGPKVPAEQSNPQFTRYSAGGLAELAAAPTPGPKITAKKLADVTWPNNSAELGAFFDSLSNALMEEVYDLYDQAIADRAAFFVKEGVIAVLQADDRAHEGMVMAEAAGGFRAAAAQPPPTFVITAEQYNRIARLLEHKEPVRCAST